MFNRGRSLVTLSADGLTLTVNISALRSRLAKSEHHIISQLHGDHAVALARANRIFTHIAHPQELQALARQVAGRAAEVVCHRCSNADGDDPDLVFARCNILRGVPRACENCFFRHKALRCSLNPMRRESAAGSDAPASVTSSERSSGERMGTRAFVRDRENDELMADMSSPTRASNRRRLIVTLSSLESLVTRGRLRSSDAAEEPSGRDADAVEDLSLFLSQDEDDNDSLPEQHDNYDGFDSDIEAGRLSESPDVVSTAEETKSTVFPPANSSETHEVWAPTSRQRSVVEGTPLSWENRYEESLRTYATNARTILGEVTKKKKEEEKEKSEMKSLE